MAEFWKLHCITYDNDVISKNLAVINMAEVSKTRQIMTVFNIASKVCKIKQGSVRALSSLRKVWSIIGIINLAFFLRGV